MGDREQLIVDLSNAVNSKFAYTPETKDLLVRLRNFLLDNNLTELQSCNDYSVEETTALMKQFPILQFFAYTHLKVPILQETSKHFADLAFHTASKGVAPQEVAAGLRKLLEAKDCAVRSLL